MTFESLKNTACKAVQPKLLCTVFFLHMTHVKDSFPTSKKTVKNRFESTKTVNVVLSSQSLLSAQQYMHNCTVTLSTSSALLASAPWEQCLFVCLYMHSEQDVTHNAHSTAVLLMFMLQCCKSAVPMARGVQQTKTVLQPTPNSASTAAHHHEHQYAGAHKGGTQTVRTGYYERLSVLSVMTVFQR